MFAPTQPARPQPFPNRPPRPLLIVGGFGGGPVALQPLRRRLRAAGYDAEVADTGLGVDHGERSVERLLALTEARASAAGVPVTLVAHSRGGQFGRVATCRRPDLVTHLLTMASPLTTLFGVSLPARVAVATTALRGSLGAPGRLTLNCFRGPCCAAFRADLATPFPASVAFTSLFSRGDLVVPWRHEPGPGRPPRRGPRNPRHDPHQPERPRPGRGAPHRRRQLRVRTAFPRTCRFRRASMTSTVCSQSRTSPSLGSSFPPAIRPTSTARSSPLVSSGKE